MSLIKTEFHQQRIDYPTTVTAKGAAGLVIEVQHGDDWLELPTLIDDGVNLDMVGREFRFTPGAGVTFVIT